MAYNKEWFWCLLLANFTHFNTGQYFLYDCFSSVNTRCDKWDFPQHDQSIGFDLLFKSALEEFEDEPLHFENKLSSWLQGDVMIIGPARFEFGQRNVTHLFDGFGKVNKISFTGNDSASFTAKFVQTDTYPRSIEKNDIAPYLMFAQSNPEFNYFQKAEAFLKDADNTVVNIYKFSKDYVILSDIWRLYTFKRSDLTTAHLVDAHVPHENVFTKLLNPLSTSHPLKEHGTNHWITFASLITPSGGIFNIYRIKSAIEREFIAQVETDKMYLMHSFGQTKRYCILMAHPAYLDFYTLATTFDPLKSLFWKSDAKTKIFIVNLLNGEVKVLETEARFMEHYINAYELDNNTIVLDYVTFQDTKVYLSLLMESFRDRKKRDTIPMETCLIKRYTLHLDTLTVVPSEFHSKAGLEFVNRLDFPVINERYRYKKYCVVYGLTIKADLSSSSNLKLVKKNVCNSSHDLFWFKPNHYPSEPTFIPRPNAVEEDDGILVDIILDGEKGKSYVAIFDAETMQLKNKAYLPTVVPFLFHGGYFE